MGLKEVRTQFFTAVVISQKKGYREKTRRKTDKRKEMDRALDIPWTPEIFQNS